MENDYDGDDGEYSFLRYFSILRDKRRFSWALLSILKNNMVNALFFYLILIGDYLIFIAMFLVFCFTQFRDILDHNHDSFGSDFLTSTEKRLQETLHYMRTDFTFQLSSLCVIGGIDTLIIISLIWLATKQESADRAKQSQILPKILSIVLHLKAKLTFTIEMVILCQIFTNNFSNRTTQILMYAGTVVSLVIAAMIKFSMAFLFNIRVRLIDEVPWCTHKNAAPLINTTFKIMHGVCLALDVPQATAVVLFILSTLNVTTYIYFQPYHDQKIIYIDTYFFAVLFGQYFHILIVIFDSGSRLSESITLMLFFVAFVFPAFAFYLLRARQYSLQSRLLLDPHNIDALKTEADFEKALTLYIIEIEKSARNSQKGSHNNHTFGITNIPLTSNLFSASETQNLSKQLSGLILFHREHCLMYKHGSCFCTQFDDSLRANRMIIDEQKKATEVKKFRDEMEVIKKMSKMNRKMQNQQAVRQSSKIFELMQQEEEELKHEDSQVDDDHMENNESDRHSRSQSRRQLLPTPAQEVVQRKSSGGGTAKQGEREQDWIQEELKQFLNGIINPLFQAEHFMQQSILQQRKSQAEYMAMLPEQVQRIVEKNGEDLNILNFHNVKFMMIINILYRLIKDICDSNPKSQRLLLFRAYFELFVMRKKYLAHQTLTRVQGEEHLGIIEYTQFQNDQHYLIEKAQILYQSKEDQMLDVDKIITQNHHYQHFYDLNEETAYQLSIFWSQLSNSKNVDIEKLFETGVKTSELIKLTKDKFQQLTELGIDKRNSNLYYMYANFNKYVLNSNDQYSEYMFKMKQIQSMNKTLQDNNYKDQLNSDVDKSGFLLVKGTYHEFGKIIYANRQLCHMLGYTPDQLNGTGKTINVMMPQLISERHSSFLQIFRETGIPIFIQRVQQLFLKNEQGYIVPFKCYIKFHYDQQHGHVFCAIINKTKHFYPFKNKKRHKFDEILTIMTDDLGTICEISPSVTTHLGVGIKFVQQNQMFLQENVKIWHLFKADQGTLEASGSREVFTQLNPEFHSDSDTGKAMYAAQHCLEVIATQQQKDNMDAAAASLGVNIQNTQGAGLNLSKQGKSGKINPIKQMIQELSRQLGGIHIDVKVKMAKVCHKNVLTVRYFFIEILDNTHYFQNPSGGIYPNNYQLDAPLPQFGGDLALINTLKNGKDVSVYDNTHNTSTLMPSLAFENERSSVGLNRRMFEEGSSTESDTISKMADLIEKDIDQLIRNDKRTPKILKHIVWLVFFAFLITTIIASILTGLFVRQSLTAKSGITNLEYSLQRGLYSAHVMTQLKALINLELEVEGRVSERQVWQAIIRQGEGGIEGFLAKQIITQLDQLKTTQQKLKEVNNLQNDIMQIDFLNSQGILETQQQPSNVAINVIVSNIIDIVSKIQVLRQLKRFNLNFTDYYQYYQQVISLKNTGLTPSEQFNLYQVQQEIFFVFQNYVKVLDKYNSDTSAHYLEQGRSSLSEDVIQRFLILICIGIGSQLIIVLLVSPVTFKIRRQKYQVLLFFLRLDEHIIKQSCLKSNIFEDKFSSEQFQRGRAFDDDEDAWNVMIEEREELQEEDYVKLGSMIHQVGSDLNSMDGYQESNNSGINNPNLSGDEAMSKVNSLHQKRKQELARQMDERILAIQRKRAGLEQQLSSKNNFTQSDFTSGLNQVLESRNIDGQANPFYIIGSNFKTLKSLAHKRKSFAAKDSKTNSPSLELGALATPWSPSPINNNDGTFKQHKIGHQGESTNKLSQSIGTPGLDTIQEDDHEFKGATEKQAKILEKMREEAGMQSPLPRVDGGKQDVETFGALDSVGDSKSKGKKQMPSPVRSSKMNAIPKKEDELKIEDIGVQLEPKKVQMKENPKPQFPVSKQEGQILSTHLPAEDDNQENNEDEFLEDQILDDLKNREEILNKIQIISSQSQTSTILTMTLTFLFFFSFFIGMYLFCRYSLEAFRDSFIEMNNIHNRGLCLSQMFFYAREDFQSGFIAEKDDQKAMSARYDSQIPWDTSGYRSRSMSKLWECMNLETEFTDIKRKSNQYLRNALDIIKQSENKLCNLVMETNPFKITKDQCLNVQNDFLQKGLSLAHQDLIKSTLIMLLSYFSQIETVSSKNDFISVKLKDPTFLEYLYTNEFILRGINDFINTSVVHSILKYIDTLKNILIALFSGVQVLIIIGLVYFFGYLFGQLKKDMLSSHTMIGMLPKHLLHKKDQQKIRDFLLA